MRTKEEFPPDVQLYQDYFDFSCLPRDPSKAIPGLFFHGVDLGGEYAWYAAQNLSELGMILSPNYMAYIKLEIAAWHRSVRDQPIEELRSEGKKPGILTPTAIDNVDAVGRVRSGRPWQLRFSSLTEEQVRSRLKRSDIEIDFEIERRRIAPGAASRLDCIFVADNEDTVRRMFESHPGLVILKVKIVEALRVTKADFRWFEEYQKSMDRSLIERYWSFCQFKENVNNWEYLVDGIMEVDDSEGLEIVRSYNNNLKAEYYEFA